MDWARGQVFDRVVAQTFHAIVSTANASGVGMKHGFWTSAPGLFCLTCRPLSLLLRAIFVCFSASARTHRCMSRSPVCVSICGLYVCLLASVPVFSLCLLLLQALSLPLSMWSQVAASPVALVVGTKETEEVLAMPQALNTVALLKNASQRLGLGPHHTMQVKPSSCLFLSTRVSPLLQTPICVVLLVVLPHHSYHNTTGALAAPSAVATPGAVSVFAALVFSVTSSGCGSFSCW